MDNRFLKEVTDSLIARSHDLFWMDQEVQNWARTISVLVDPETAFLRGRVQCHLTGFESIAIGF